MDCIEDGQLLGSINGSIYNGVALDSAGKYGKAMHTDGVSQYVDLGNHRDKCFGNLDHCPHGITFIL